MFKLAELNLENPDIQNDITSETEKKAELFEIKEQDKPTLASIHKGRLPSQKRTFSVYGTEPYCISISSGFMGL